jgi:hypothetical protein
MRAQDFSTRLDAASFYATRFAATMFKDKLPYKFRYCVLLNYSYDAHHKEDEIVYPEDEGIIHRDLEAKEVVDLLCRENRVPQWIDISVEFKGSDHTNLTLLCCGRYHSDDDRLFYYEQGTQPFGIKSPNLPIRLKEGSRFRLPKEKDYFAKLRPREKP